MKTITLTAWKRPHYLARVISNLRENNCEGWKLFCSLEPGNAKTVEQCRKIDFVDKEVICNKTRLGVRDNPFSVLSKVFDAGSELNLYLEEDLRISKDATTFANWYGTIADPSKELCAMLHAKSRQTADHTAVWRQKVFSALGLVITRDQWYNYFKPNWHTDKRGWDWAVHGYFNQQEHLNVMVPKLSRATHIGIQGGVHYVHSRHKSEHEGLVMYEGPPMPENEYRIVE